MLFDLSLMKRRIIMGNMVVVITVRKMFIHSALIVEQKTANQQSSVIDAGLLSQIKKGFVWDLKIINKNI